jgi:hypothetical protein
MALHFYENFHLMRCHTHSWHERSVVKLRCDFEGV